MQSCVMTIDNSSAEFEYIFSLIEDGYNVFVTGGAGVGKSYTLNRLKSIYKDELALTSTTGVSAININGQTIHSWSGIGLANKSIEETVKNIKRKSSLYRNLICCDKLAIDEISMLDNRTFDYVNEVLKSVRMNDKPFGGIQVIALGDFFQLPPVKLGVYGKDFCFNSETWKELKFKPVILTEIKRQSQKDLAEALNRVRLNEISDEDIEMFERRNLSADEIPPRDVLQIFGTNSEADNYNQESFNELTTTPYYFDAKDEIYLYDDNKLLQILNVHECLENEISKFDWALVKKFDEECKAPLNLVLKEGCRVMLLQNIDVRKGLANGTCGVVKSLTPSFIDVLFDNGVRASIEPSEFEYIREGKTKIKRYQYPLRLAYGITIHKSQGMTFDNLVVNLNRIFDCGQAYVALSRTRTLEGLILKGFSKNKIMANPKVVEFYKSLIDSI